MSRFGRCWSCLVFPVVLLGMTSSPSRGGPAEDLAKLCDDYWQQSLKLNPTEATALGDTRYDDRLDDNSPAGHDADRKLLETTLARAKAIDASKLSPQDRITRSALIEECEGGLARGSCKMWEWVVDPLGGPQVDFVSLVDYTKIETPADAQKFVTRCRAMGTYIDQHIANLKRGLAAGKTSSIDAVKKTLGEVDALTSAPIDGWAMLKPAKEDRPKWSAADRDHFKADLTKAITESLKPALVRYGQFLKNEELPKARPQDKAGLVAIPDGLECYKKLIKVHTSLDLSPEQLHQLGLEQVAKFRKDLSELGQKALGTSDIATIQKKLRDDPSMQFKTADEVEKKAQESLARAKAAIPGYFGILPKADCVVKVMGMHEAPNSTIAYYRQPAADGSRPGYYMINTYKPETRPRYEAEALAFHESIPGHHLQIAIAQELKGIPEFRKHEGVTAFVEGWALYTERLADEMGLYSSDVDRIGMLSYDAWRGCRLVVDTGIHAMGWSRQQAIDYMIANSVLAPNNIENEVDRYITWPGQALAYKVGQLEILKLRQEAKDKLGSRFDIKQFHDVVLKNGAVALPVLREQVEGWIAEQTKVATP
jgi:uncharacterized protein (DUF885 family)